MIATGRCVENAVRYLGQSRFQVYLDFAERYGRTESSAQLADLAMTLYRWNVEISGIVMSHISYVEVCVRNAVDTVLREWVASYPPLSHPDWLEMETKDPVERIKALINSPERDYCGEAMTHALMQQRRWRSDQRHPRHGERANRDDVFAQLSFGTWDGLLKRSSADPEIAQVLMRAFPLASASWEVEIRKMPHATLPGDESRPLSDRLRLELAKRLQSIRTVRNRAGHGENLLYVDFPVLRRNIYFVMSSLDANCIRWAFPEGTERLRTANPRDVVQRWEQDHGVDTETNTEQ